MQIRFLLILKGKLSFDSTHQISQTFALEKPESNPSWILDTLSIIQCWFC